MNHKRCRPKNQRAGCLMCKPWKVNGVGKARKGMARPHDFRQFEAVKQDLTESTNVDIPDSRRS